MPRSGTAIYHRRMDSTPRPGSPGQRRAGATRTRPGATGAEDPAVWRGTSRSPHARAETLRTQPHAHMVTTERLRLARDLPAMVAPSIGVIAIQAGMANRVITVQPAEARNALQAIETTSRQTLAGLRQMLTTLRHADP